MRNLFNKNKTDKQEIVWDKLELEQQLKQALSFINPELDEEQIFYQLHLLILNMIDVNELKKELNFVRKIANTKLDEVKFLYEVFSLTTNETDN